MYGWQLLARYTRTPFNEFQAGKGRRAEVPQCREISENRHVLRANKSENQISGARAPEYCVISSQQRRRGRVARERFGLNRTYTSLFFCVCAVCMCAYMYQSMSKDAWDMDIDFYKREYSWNGIGESLCRFFFSMKEWKYPPQVGRFKAVQYRS